MRFCGRFNVSFRIGGLLPTDIGFEGDSLLGIDFVVFPGRLIVGALP
jgi:hypothetical protein